MAEFRRQIRAPNKKKYDEEMEELLAQIRAKDAELVGQQSYSKPLFKDHPEI